MLPDFLMTWLLRADPLCPIRAQISDVEIGSVTVMLTRETVLTVLWSTDWLTDWSAMLRELLKLLKLLRTFEVSSILRYKAVKFLIMIFLKQ